MKRKILILLSALIIMFAVPVIANAATSGSCGANGNNVTWTLDDAGTLTISGTGEMADYITPSDRPWSFGNTIKSVVVKSGITYIGSYAFSATHVQAVTIENGVLKIGDGAFWDSDLVQISIPNSVNEIGDSAFAKCYELKSIGLPSGITIIGNNAFQFDTNLTKIDIPNSVKTIGDTAFYGAGIISVTIPSSVTNIGSGAFRYCDSLTYINVESGNAFYSSDNGVLFDKYKNKLIQCPIGKQESGYKIPNSVEEISACAFEGCKLSNITIPMNIKIINTYAFYQSAIDSISIPDGIETIGEYAFAESALTSINIPGSVKDMGSQVFYYCTNLKRVVLGEGITGIPWSTFCGCAQLDDVVIPNGVTEIGSYAFCDCTGLKTITIPKSVTTIKNAAFTECNNLSDVYYGGTEQEWKSIDVDIYSGMDGGDMYVTNKPLLNATIHYNSTGIPSETVSCFTVSGSTVTNTADTVQTATVIAADYTGGVLTDIHMQTETFSAGESKQFQYGQGMEHKILVWNSINEMRPLTK